MSIADWIKRLRGAPSSTDEAAEIEEYGARDHRDPPLQAEYPGPRDAANDLGEFRAPRDPNP
ncbi:MAG TPA: hypothetical protein VH560_19565 [Polyangia bacterium]|jgi:hypothetical protein|nr:hypothetical protein [Polyangia bacterium]